MWNLLAYVSGLAWCLSCTAITLAIGGGGQMGEAEAADWLMCCVLVALLQTLVEQPARLGIYHLLIACNQLGTSCCARYVLNPTAQLLTSRFNGRAHKLESVYRNNHIRKIFEQIDACVQPSTLSA